MTARQKKGVNYHIDIENSDSEDDFVPPSKKTKSNAVGTGAPTVFKRSSREERQFNKELERALEASLVTPATDPLEGTRDAQQHCRGAPPVPAGKTEVAGSKKKTLKVIKDAETSSIEGKKVRAERIGADTQQLKTEGRMSPGESISYVSSTELVQESTSNISDHLSQSTSNEPRSNEGESQPLADPSVPCTKRTIPASNRSTSTKPPSKLSANCYSPHSLLLSLDTTKAVVCTEQVKHGTKHSVRVGLSRNVHIKPLHPKVKTISQ